MILIYIFKKYKKNFFSADKIDFAFFFNNAIKQI